MTINEPLTLLYTRRLLLFGQSSCTLRAAVHLTGYSPMPHKQRSLLLWRLLKLYLAGCADWFLSRSVRYVTVLTLLLNG